MPPQDEDSESSEDSGAETNLQKLVKSLRQERDTSADEDDIPLMELSKHFKEKWCRQSDEAQAISYPDENIESQDRDSESEQGECMDSDMEDELESDQPMSLNALSRDYKMTKPHNQSTTNLQTNWTEK